MIGVDYYGEECRNHSFQDWPPTSWGTVVYNQGVPLSLLMKLVALIALDLAFLRVQPFLPQSPLQLFALVMLDLVMIQYFILGRRLGAFHYTFLIVGLVASLALHTLAGHRPAESSASAGQ
jgi:hypothetical protein